MRAFLTNGCGLPFRTDADFLAVQIWASCLTDADSCYTDASLMRASLPHRCELPHRMDVGFYAAQTRVSLPNGCRVFAVRIRTSRTHTHLCFMPHVCGLCATRMRTSCRTIGNTQSDLSSEGLRVSFEIPSLLILTVLGADGLMLPQLQPVPCCWKNGPSFNGVDDCPSSDQLILCRLCLMTPNFKSWPTVARSGSTSNNEALALGAHMDPAS